MNAVYTVEHVSFAYGPGQTALSDVSLEIQPGVALFLRQNQYVKGDRLIMRDLRRNDAERLYQLIARHKSFTGSSRANHILSNWDEYLPKFRKVMPVEYKKALARLEQEQAAMRTAAE